MKKNYSKILIITIVSFILTLILCYLAIYDKLELSGINFFIDKAANNDTPAAGWLLLGGLLFGALVDSIVLFIHFLILFLPSLLLFIVVLLQIITRLLQNGNVSEKKKRTSKNLTRASIVIYILLLILLVFSLTFNIRIYLLIIALVLNIVCLVFIIKELKKTSPNS